MPSGWSDTPASSRSGPVHMSQTIRGRDRPRDRPVVDRQQGAARQDRRPNRRCGLASAAPLPGGFTGHEARVYGLGISSDADASGPGER